MATKITTKVVRKKTASSTESTENMRDNKQDLNKRKRMIVGLGGITALVLIAGLLYVLRSWYMVATVNGQPIMRYTYDRELEKQNGKQVLSNIVTKTLVTQEAKRQNVTVSQQELDQEVKKIQDSLTQQGRDLATVLSAQGSSREDFMDEIRLEKLVTKMAPPTPAITDQEINSFITSNKDAFPQGTTDQAMKDAAIKQLQQQKQSTNLQNWLKSLQDKAKINYFVQQ